MLLIYQQMSTENSDNSEQQLYCELCDYKCYRKYDFKKHKMTAKHQNQQKSTKTSEKSEQIITCLHCGKIFKDRSGLWRHKKKCLIQEETDELSDKNLILTLIQQNNELQKQMLEVIKNGTHNNNTTHTNSHNKSFNLNLYLNETCKDALNIAEFVSSIKMDLDDLETTGRLGYVEGVTRIINKNLNDLDQTKRPIHCSDVKREVLYIKNDDQWVKENETKPILTKAIKQIANENIKQIGEWRKKYPDCTDSDSRKNDMYLNIVSNAMSGTTVEEQTTNYEKIITKVAKEVVIEK